MPFHERPLTPANFPKPAKAKAALPPTATIEAYCAAYRAALAQRPDFPADRVNPFVSKVRSYLIAKRTDYCHHDTGALAAWKAVGGKGKPTWKALFAMPLGTPPGPEPAKPPAKSLFQTPAERAADAATPKAPRRRNIGGSLFGSTPPDLHAGACMVRPLPDDDTHALVDPNGVELARHPNGWSCQALGQRLEKQDRAKEQADYIIACGGTVTAAGWRAVAAATPKPAKAAPAPRSAITRPDGTIVSADWHTLTADPAPAPTPARPAWMSTHVVDPAWLTAYDANARLKATTGVRNHPTVGNHDLVDSITTAITKHITDAFDPKALDRGHGTDAGHALDRLLGAVLTYVNEAHMDYRDAREKARKEGTKAPTAPAGFLVDDGVLYTETIDAVWDPALKEPLAAFLREMADICTEAAEAGSRSEDVDTGAVLAWAWSMIRDGHTDCNVTNEDLIDTALDNMDRMDMEELRNELSDTLKYGG